MGMTSILHVRDDGSLIFMLIFVPLVCYTFVNYLFVTAY